MRKAKRALLAVLLTVTMVTSSLGVAAQVQGETAHTAEETGQETQTLSEEELTSEEEFDEENESANQEGVLPGEVAVADEEAAGSENQADNEGAAPGDEETAAGENQAGDSSQAKKGLYFDGAQTRSNRAVLDSFDFDITELEAVDLDSIEELYPFAQDDSAKVRSFAAMEESQEITGPETETVESEINLNDDTEFWQEQQSKARTARASSYVGYEFSDVLTYEGQEYAVYPIWLSPGEILQAQLTIPQDISLNYDLLLCAFDMSTGNLNPTAIDASTMPTTTAYTPEGVGTINRTNSDAAYAIFVVARQGYSTSKSFTLNVTIGAAGSFDGAEPNENIYKAVSLPSLGDGGTWFSFDANTNTPYDNDWYVLYVPNLNAFSSVNIAATKDLNIEVYAANSSGQPYRTSAHKSDGNYQLVAGYNYFRVSAKPGAFSSDVYNLKFKANLGVEYYTFDYIVNNRDCIRASNNFEDRQYRLVVLTARNLEWRVTYYNAAGYPVSGVYNPLKIHYYNPKWAGFTENPPADNDHGNRIRYSYDVSDDQGRARVVVPCGALRNPNGIGMGWDQVIIYFAMPNTGFSTSTTMALIPKYDNGELNDSCYQHRGSYCPVENKYM